MLTNRLLPKPKKIEEKPGTFRLPDAMKASLSLTRSSIAANLSAHPSVNMRVESGPDPEAYRLAVTPDGIEIVGGGEPGLFYGAKTLLQLIDGDTVPCCEIEDAPDYKNRMVMYDLARENTFNMAHMKHVIDILADHKVNMFHLYLENYFQFSKHPDASPPGVMTPDQARELDDYARERFIEIVPEVNCLAHLDNVLAMDKYLHFAEDPSLPWEICTLNPEAVEFVHDLVREVVVCFKSGYFHMGGDESGLGACPKCKARVEADGGKQKLFAEHYTHMAEFIKSFGKRPMMWGDMLLHNRGTAELMPKDIIIFDWHYDDTTVETVKYFTSQGFDVYASPALSGYGRLTSPYRHSTGNIYKFVGEGVEGGAIGECTCDWELRLGNLFVNDTWGILLSADRSWNLGAGDMADYEKRFCKEFFGLDDTRPVDYFKELSDGYASIFESTLPPSSWAAFGPLTPSGTPDIGSKITQEMLDKSDKKLAELESMLDDLRRSVKQNADMLEFADLPAHSAYMMLRKFAFAYQAGQLVEEARLLKSQDREAADFKILRAISLLKEIDKDQDYFERRFAEAAKLYGSSTVDLERVAATRKEVAARIAEAERL